MKREIKKAFGQVSTQNEYTNSEMDTLVQVRNRIHECIVSFNTKKPEFLVRDEYCMLQDIFDVIIGDYRNETENAFEKAFEVRKASLSAMNVGEDDETLA